MLESSNDDDLTTRAEVKILGSRCLWIPFVPLKKADVSWIFRGNVVFL